MNEYKTSDSKKAATLMAMGADMVEFNSDNPDKFIFTLYHPEIEEMVNNINTGNAVVNPNDLWDKHKRIKDLVIDTKRMK